MIASGNRGCEGAANRVEIRLLGGFEVRAHVGLLELAVTCARMLAYLALLERPALRLNVAAALWPDVVSERALASLRSTLWRIRRTDKRLVEAAGENLWLGPAVATDVGRLTRIARASDHGSEAGLGESLGRLAYELLPGWSETWVLLERERFRLLSMNVLERSAVALAQQGMFVAAIESAMSAIRLEPLRESAYRALMLVHLEQGNPAEVARTYERYRMLLRSEVGLQPSDEIDAMMAGLRANQERT